MLVPTPTFKTMIDNPDELGRMEIKMGTDKYVVYLKKVNTKLSHDGTTKEFVRAFVRKMG